jgi:hypothetical protein
VIDSDDFADLDFLVGAMGYQAFTSVPQRKNEGHSKHEPRGEREGKIQDAAGLVEDPVTCDLSHLYSTKRLMPCTATYQREN